MRHKENNNSTAQRHLSIPDAIAVGCLIITGGLFCSTAGQIFPELSLAIHTVPNSKNENTATTIESPQIQGNNLFITPALPEEVCLQYIPALRWAPDGKRLPGKEATFQSLAKKGVSNRTIFENYVVSRSYTETLPTGEIADFTCHRLRSTK